MAKDTNKLLRKPVQDRAKEVVRKAYNDSKSFQENYFDKFRKFYDLYRGVQTNKHYFGRANLFVPESFTAIETIHARMMRAFNGVRVKPQSGDDVEAAEHMGHLLDYQTRIYNFKQSLKDCAKDALIYGTGVLKAGWIFKEDGKRDHPIIQTVDIADYFFDPDAVNRAEARWEIHRTYMTKEEIMLNPEYDVPVEFKNRKQSQGNRNDDSTLKQSRREAQGVSSKTPQGDKFEVIEYWGLFAEDEDDERSEYKITVVDNDFVVEIVENPYKELFKDGVVDEALVRPFIIMKDVDVPQEFYGIGEIEPIERLQEELNDTRNQRMDNVTMILDRMWAVLDGANVDENELVMRAGGVVHMAIPNGVTPLPVADVTQSSYQEEQLIKEDIQKALGMPEVATGSLQGAQGETATTILALQETANIRFDVKISNFADAVRHAYSLIMAYNQKWLDKKVSVRIENEEGFEFPEIDKESIKGKLDMDVQMDTQMNKIVRRQEAFQLYGLLASNPLINQQVNTTDLLETLDRSNLQQLFDVPPPPPPQPAEPDKRISVSLRGDANKLESSDLLQLFGAKPESGDPLLDPDLRRLMQGEQGDEKDLEIQEKLLEEKRLENDQHLKVRELDLKEREITLKEKQAGISGSEAKRQAQASRLPNQLINNQNGQGAKGFGGRNGQEQSRVETSEQNARGAQGGFPQAFGR